MGKWGLLEFDCCFCVENVGFRDGIDGIEGTQLPEFAVFGVVQVLSVGF